MKKLLAILLVMLLALTALAACGGGDDEELLPIESALSYVSAMYKGGKETTASDYTLIAKAPGNDDNYYDITWTVDVDDIEITVDAAKGTATVDVPDEPMADIPYVLTATINDADGNSVSTSFNRKVPKFKTLTWDEYLEAEDDAAVAIDGVITGIISKSLGDSYNCLYVQSEDGGYYVYGLTSDPIADDDLAVGMTVRVKGNKDNYSGTYEIVSASVTVISEEITPVTPVDYTEIYKNATALTDEALAGKQAMLVTVKGVQITGQDTSNGYYRFKLGELESYIRISSSVCPLNAGDTEAFKALHTEKNGYIADVTGVICVYSGAFYLTPVDSNAISNVTLPERTDAEKVALELESLKVVESVNSDGAVDFPTAGSVYPDDVTITWASNSENAVVADGRITFTIPDDTVEVTLTATVTCGEATDTKEFKVKLSKTITSIADAIEIAKGLVDKGDPTADKYLVAGVITELATENNDYGNCYITDASGETIYVYGLYDANDVRYDKMENKPVVGDYVVLLSVIGHYNNPQLKNAHIVTLVKPITIPEASEIGAAQTAEYTTEKYMTSGVITEFYGSNGTKYGNVYIQDAEGNTIIVYGLYDAAGTRYDAMTTKPVVGDTITVYGILGQYQGTAQFKDATLIAHTVAATEDPETPVDPEDPDEPVLVPELVTAPEAGKVYYLGLTFNNEFNYLTGKLQSEQYYYRQLFSTVQAEACAFKLVAVEGGYNLTIEIDGATKYINIKANGNYVNLLIEDTAQCVWTWSETYKTITVTVPDNGEYAITQTGTYANVEAKKVDVVGVKVQLYTLVEGTPDDGDDTPEVPVDPSADSIVFDFGNNGTAGTHTDGNDIGATKTYTSGNYELVITDANKVYDGGFDKAGNSILKFGTSSVAGTVTFVVPDNVTSVVIYAARYKSYADNSTIVINGTAYTLSTNSDDGQYEAITIDTTTVKTITITSECTSGKPRMVINSIVYMVASANEENA